MQQSHELVNFNESETIATETGSMCYSVSLWLLQVLPLARAMRPVYGTPAIIAFRPATSAPTSRPSVAAPLYELDDESS